MSKSVSIKYNQKFPDHAKQSATDAHKTDSKRTIKKAAEETGDLIDDKISDKITKISRIAPHNRSEKAENETEK